MNPIGLLKTPIGIIASVVFLGAVAAIIAERAINNLLLDGMNSWAVLGLAILLLAFIPVIVHRRLPPPPFWLIAGIGAALIIYGNNIGI